MSAEVELKRYAQHKEQSFDKTIVDDDYRREEERYALYARARACVCVCVHVCVRVRVCACVPDTADRLSMGVIYSWIRGFALLICQTHGHPSVPAYQELHPLTLQD